jgi:hypothetical protein
VTCPGTAHEPSAHRAQGEAKAPPKSVERQIEAAATRPSLRGYARIAVCVPSPPNFIPAGWRPDATSCSHGRSLLLTQSPFLHASTMRWTHGKLQQFTDYSFRAQKNTILAFDRSNCLNFD